MILKIDMPVLLAVLVFLLHFIPNLGTAISTVPGVAVALLQHGPGTALAVAIGYVVINGVIGNVNRAKGDGPYPRFVAFHRAPGDGLLGLALGADRRAPVGAVDDDRQGIAFETPRISGG